MKPLPFCRIHFDTIDSTNDWAKGHLERCSTAGITLVTADAQTAGRGRFERKWVSPPGLNLYATFVFFVPGAAYDAMPVVQLLAKAAQSALKRFGFACDIKWPNDLLIAGKKVAGILCETRPHGEYVAVIVGFGLNVNMPAEILAHVGQPATSLAVEGNAVFDREEILAAIQEEFEPAVRALLKKG